MSAKHYFGKYRGIVKDNVDPAKLGRVRCMVPEVLGIETFTGWAYPILAIGSGGGTGSITVPKLESGVWVEFEAGNVDRPIYGGGWAAQPSAVSELPDLAKGIADESASPPKGTDSFTMADGTNVSEPPIPFAAVYPHNAVLKTRAGIVEEVDSTPGAVRIHLWHPAKSWIEIHPDGTIVIRSAADRYIIIEGDDALHVKGDWNVRVDGTARITASGEVKIDAQGNVEIDADGDILLAGGGPPIARLGDEVHVTGGSSAGVYPIVSGSRKAYSG